MHHECEDCGHEFEMDEAEMAAYAMCPSCCSSNIWCTEFDDDYNDNGDD